MKSQFNKVVDDKGRVHIPYDLRKSAGIQENDIVRMCAHKNMVIMERIEIKEEDIIEKLKNSFNNGGAMPDDAIEGYILAALGTLDKKKLKEIMDCLEELLNKKAKES